MTRFVTLADANARDQSHASGQSPSRKIREMDQSQLKAKHMYHATDYVGPQVCRSIEINKRSKFTILEGMKEWMKAERIKSNISLLQKQ